VRAELEKALDKVNELQRPYLRSLNELVRVCIDGDKELDQAKAALALYRSVGANPTGQDPEGE